MNNSDFSDINKTSADTFAKQRRMIKDLCMGKMVSCPECLKPVSMVGPSTKAGTKAPGIYCAKGCTNIELEFEQ